MKTFCNVAIVMLVALLLSADCMVSCYFYTNCPSWLSGENCNAITFCGIVIGVGIVISSLCVIGPLNNWAMTDGGPD